MINECRWSSRIWCTPTVLVLILSYADNWEYAQDSKSRRQSYANLRETMTNKCKYLHARTKSEAIFINYLSRPDVGRDTYAFISPQDNVLQKLYTRNALGPG